MLAIRRIISASTRPRPLSYVARTIAPRPPLALTPSSWRSTAAQVPRQPAPQAKAPAQASTLRSLLRWTSSFCVNFARASTPSSLLSSSSCISGSRLTMMVLPFADITTSNASLIEMMPLNAQHLVMIGSGAIIKWAIGWSWLAYVIWALVAYGLYIQSQNKNIWQVLKGTDLTGQVAIVTGATTGIGLYTAAALAWCGARVFIIARSRESGDNAVKEAKQLIARQPLVTERKVMNTSLEVLVMDLADSKSIMAATKTFIDMKLPLHLLVLNAGSIGGPDCTKDGVEHTLGVTHFGHFGVTKQLLPILQQTSTTTAADQSKPRVVVLSSMMHMGVKQTHFPQLLRWNEIDAKDQPSSLKDPMDLYSSAKVANILFARELQRRTGDAIHVSAVHPGGMIPTSIARNTPNQQWFIWLAGIFTKTIDQGAATTAYACLHGTQGRYYADTAEAKPATGLMAKFSPGQAIVADPAAATSLWNDTDTRWNIAVASHTAAAAAVTAPK